MEANLKKLSDDTTSLALKASKLVLSADLQEKSLTISAELLQLAKRWDAFASEASKQAVRFYFFQI